MKEADDVLGALEFIKGRTELKGLPIFAIGESMGGSAVIRAAAQSPHIRGMVSESTYATLHDALWQRIKLLGPIASSVAKRCYIIGASRYGVQIADVSPERDITRFTPRPILLIHDKWDLLCTRKESDRLYDAAGEPKERWDVPYSPHTFAFMIHPKEYERRVINFFDQCLQQASD